MTPQRTPAGQRQQPARDSRLPARLDPDLAGVANRLRPWLLPPALDAERRLLARGGPPVALYLSPLAAAPHTAAGRTPLLMVHSVHTAASAAELRPAFERLSLPRPVVALELPGFGSSARDPLRYTPRVMTHAILRAVQHLRDKGLQLPVDVMGVSLSCEFVVRAALAQPRWFRSVGMVSPTGLESDRIEAFEDGRSAERVLLHRLLQMPPWSAPLFRLLTIRPLLRHGLRRVGGAQHVDAALLDYAARSAAVPGARHAPYAYLSGALHTLGMAELYASLSHPVWVAHGVRGGFADALADHGALRRIGPPSHWTVDVFDTGALPYFDATEPFALRYEAFLGSVRVTSGRLPRQPGNRYEGLLA